MRDLPIYCARCPALAVVQVDAGTPDGARRSATACHRHKSAVRRWAAHAGTPVLSPIDQPMHGQLTLFPAPEEDTHP